MVQSSKLKQVWEMLHTVSPSWEVRVQISILQKRCGFSREDWFPMSNPVLDKGTLFSSRARTMVRGMGQVRPLEPQAQSVPKNSMFNRNNILVQYLKKSKLI